MAAALAVAYHTLVDGLDADERADVDAILDGRGAEVVARDEAARTAQLLELALDGEVRWPAELKAV